jgi:hypothetical protein
MKTLTDRLRAATLDIAVTNYGLTEIIREYTRPLPFLTFPAFMGHDGAHAPDPRGGDLEPIPLRCSFNAAAHHGAGRGDRAPFVHFRRM